MISELSAKYTYIWSAPQRDHQKPGEVLNQQFTHCWALRQADFSR